MSDDELSSENDGPVMLVLSAAQAEQVRYRNIGQSGLDPVALADGATYVLPTAVLNDPAHSEKRSVLETLEHRRIAPSEWVAAVSDI